MYKGVKLTSADGKHAIKKNNDTFVDECDGVASKCRATFKASKKATRTHLKSGTKKWSHIITATGGGIAFHKDGWMMCAFEPNHGNQN